MSWIQDEIAHFSKLLTKWQDKAVMALKELEADAEPLFKQIQHELTVDAYAAAKTELTAVMSAAMSGGGIEAIGKAIADTIPGLISTLKVDGNTAAKNALYGLAAIVQAGITSKMA